MRRRLLVIAALALAGVLAVPSVALASKTATGNGAPSGPHFNLNIHGMSKSNGTSYSGNNKNDIFVPLTGKCTIHLQKGTPFEVVQPNCTKHTSAMFQLPTPCTTTTCTTFAYEVWVRAVTPKGHATMSTCYVTPTTGTTFCSTRVVTLSKHRKFSTVTTTLLTVCTATTDTFTPIFATSNKTYLWQYTNSGLRLAQFRFYPITKPTTIVGTACTATGPSPR
jgi:hypothetical protein